MSAILLFLFLLQITAFSFAIGQQEIGNIRLGVSLNFAFEFYNEGNKLAVGIWYAKIQQKTIVWTANRDASLPLSNDVKLLLSGKGIMVMSPDNQVVLATISNIYEPTASASMLDSSKFVLYNSNSKIIWQSFDTSTDTIASSQRLLAGNKIVSNISDTNHTSGRFRLLMQRDGNLVKYSEGLIVLQPYHAYWNTGTFRLYLINSTNYKIWNNMNQNQLFDMGMYRMLINFDGILRLYSHSLIHNDSWSDPPCVCLPGFVFIDQRQRYLGCRRNVSTVGCPDENRITYSIVDLDGFTACREDCLRDCNCEAAVYSDKMCQKQRFPLTFGRTDGTITGFVIYGYCVADYKKIPNLENGRFVEDVALRSYTYCELEKATKGFRVIPSNGGRVVAIKKLEKMMNAIGMTHHKNLVKLLGYFYEYMTNGSLVDFFFQSNRRPTWKENIGICLNVAQGILYLHEECDTQIIHCDIKPENILMSDQKCAKLADFGTRGYVAPKWHRNVPITVKADVYNFGVVLLEIICYRRCNWVYHCLEVDELDKLVKDEDVDKNELQKMVKIGLWCIQDELAFRPSMKKIVLMLEGMVKIPNLPSFASISSSVS
ncbi:G-type lectin S-receptor-like serine/threonine-protein kinase RLK1 [Pyrus ussuriensis x Pyrus communis]|uniref:G-type lectin S-receptor-like serine/threonine-protein kinase RLK1 n=1 Tax=Pyrus ussuriensis x Pyrus communis TaxID=2448454 RepID=A0A5N5I4T2_9ROSA|nr:G-type lectin S-receptor-like serine/threonine-protein kinase RLK1 [Pyrus ussuriensis x Pyrus communis]